MPVDPNSFMMTGIVDRRDLRPLQGVYEQDFGAALSVLDLETSLIVSRPA